MARRFLLVSAALPLSIALITGCTDVRSTPAQPISPPDAQPISPASAQPGASGDRAWRAEVLLDTGSKLSGVAVGDLLRGAVLADLDTNAPGLEAATVGYDGTIRVFTLASDEWREAIVAHDTDRFHHLTSGELPGWDGIVLIGVNYSGKVTVAGRAR